MSDSIAAFIEARVIEAEASAREFHEARICSGCSDGWEAGFDPDRCDCGYPVRVLAEVAAKRAIIATTFQYEAKIDGEWGCCHSADAIARGYCPDTKVDEIDILRRLAAVWSSHPDYRQEWAPSGE